MAKIPRFKSLKNTADFWDAHDFEDYRDDTEAVSISVKLPRQQRAITIPLELKIYQQIETLAAKRGVSVEKMVSRWLKEKAKVETARQ